MNLSKIAFPYHLITVSSHHAISVGGYVIDRSPVSRAVYTNIAFYYPFRLPTFVTATLMFIFNGAVANGNVDVGIYDNTGTRLVSSGPVAQAGINQIQTINIADTKIGPGLFYMAFSFNNNTATLFANSAGFNMIRTTGCVEEANAHPLPAVATFASYVHAYLWVFGFTTRGFV